MNHYSRPHARVAAALLLALVGFPCICFSQTGNSVIDGYISYEDWQIKVGSTAAPENLAPTSYAGIINRCNSSFAPSWESNCPSDLLYTPNHWTGGYQAFGVALNRRDESTDLVYDCYTWWYQDEVGNWVMDYSCELCRVSEVPHPPQLSKARLIPGLLILASTEQRPGCLTR